jgi:hypothetical protein
MERVPLRTSFAALAVTGLLAAALTACGSGDDSTAASTSTTSAAGATSAASDGALAKACGDNITVQLQWQPQSDMGALFELLGSGYTFDAKQKSVTGELVSHGTDTGVTLTLRAGGDAVGFQPVPSVMYLDKSIDFGLVHTDVMIASSGDQPVVGVTPLLTHSPAMLMWDPATQGKDFDLTKLADTDDVVVVSADQAFPAWLEAKGFVKKSQIDTSYDGSPSRFVSDPSIVEQGFANSEPWTFEHETPSWNKPIGYELLKDLGYDQYASNLTVRKDRLEELAPCLKQFVPMVQQAGVDYITDPQPTNKVITDVVASDSTFSPYTMGEANYSAKLLKDKGLVENEGGTFGGYDEKRLDSFVSEVAPMVRDQGSNVPAGLTADDLFTDRFVDPSVKIQ